MHPRPIHLHFSGSADETVTDADLADLRDIIIELIARFPKVTLHGYSVSGWLHDGTALDGETPTEDTTPPRHVLDLLRDLGCKTRTPIR